ncbi:helix-turn-helix protein [Streptomyces sp. TLI_235]|nr:helix-turn-helix transcriptional regulator [Streptomyces sp. TLI_235]PBC72213.1 helix-turn-helix protein [Streptomyces sp. TLI_235]
MSAGEDEQHLDWAGLGEEIRRSRVARKLSQQQLAEQAGLDRKTVSNYENGRVPSPGRIPDGYHSVARVLEWADGKVEQTLGAPDRRGERAVAPSPLEPTASRGDLTPAELYPGVVAFARACVRAGADPGLRDDLEEAAERLLRSASASRGHQGAYGMAAYRPHGWSEGDPGVPEDDQERIRQAVRDYREGRP